MEKIALNLKKHAIKNKNIVSKKNLNNAKSKSR